MNSQDRHLKAVMFSDIEGYTAMVQADEQSAIEMVNLYQSKLEQLVSDYHGEVKQHYGDGSLTIFPSVGEALSCALALQRELRRRIPLRMGIHYGPVIMHQGKVFGETVNLASRIESLGQPGSILFSEEVNRQLESAAGFRAVPMGSFRFKNVNRQMEVFALYHSDLTIPKVGSLKGKLEPPKTYKVPVIISGILGLVFLGLLIYNLTQPPAAKENIFRGSVNPSIAVLPFANLSADSSQDYFADGLAQEVLNLLTRDPQLKVTSRSSSFSFKGQQLDIPTIAGRLGVEYILDGSVQKSGNSVRVSVKLIDTGEDTQLWAQSWGRDLGDVFAIQQEIADSVKTNLKLQILADRNQNYPSTSSKAYTLFLQARYTWQQGNVDRLLNAERLIRESLSIDSTYAPAWANLSVFINRQSNIGLIPAESGQEEARAAALKALSIDSTTAIAWATLVSISVNYDRDYKMAGYYLEKARKWDPGSLNGLKLASNLAFYQGDLEQAIAMDEQALEIDPVNPKNYLDLGYGYFNNGQYAEAETATRQGLLMNPDYLGGYHLLSMILMKQDKLSEAREVAKTEPYDILKVQALAIVAQAMGKQDSATLLLQQIKDQHAQVAAYQIAQVYGHQKQTDSTFKWLQKAYEYRDGGLAHVQADTFFQGMRRDPRWDQLMAQLNFNEAVDTKLN